VLFGDQFVSHCIMCTKLRCRYETSFQLRRQTWAMGLSPPNTSLSPHRETYRSEGELCKIFKFWLFLQSKSVNSVCKLLQLLGDDIPQTHKRQSIGVHGLLAPQYLPLLFKMHLVWSVDSRENYWNCCHEMSYFKAKMHQIWFRLGSLQRSSRPLSCI